MSDAIVPFSPPVPLLPTIRRFRGIEVVADFEIAAAYGVKTQVLMQAVRRNQERFPPDFAFQLTENEAVVLISQIVLSKTKDSRGGRQKPITVFSEHGVLALSFVLRSETATKVGLEIVREFVRMRQDLAWHERISTQVDKLQTEVEQIFATLDEMQGERTFGSKRIGGFHPLPPQKDGVL